MAEKELKLMVAEAVQEYIGKGIVRVAFKHLKELNLNPGGIIEVECKRKTFAIASISYPGDAGLNFVRMDGKIRDRTEANISEFVAIRNPNQSVLK